MLVPSVFRTFFTFSFVFLSQCWLCLPRWAAVRATRPARCRLGWLPPVDRSTYVLFPCIDHLNFLSLLIVNLAGCFRRSRPLPPRIVVILPQCSDSQNHCLTSNIPLHLHPTTPVFSTLILMPLQIQNIMGTREVSALEAIVISDYQDRFSGQ
ncbi:hypothetical protein BV22DRAFT_273982 [Leucogyrophana mollusca]|uniref:Uncharacterized protein n=1 Tax=Leucogyrophana mollusca TaxID=85980 RepID=A0ACB8BQC9_9AGAM|nr:hypothetical protein BV22DRAFT_273982 [Leucogyrophana mollusca]